MVEEPEDLVIGEGLLVAKMITDFTRAIERVGFVYHSRLDAIAVLSIGCIAMRLCYIPDEEIIESIKRSMFNTRKDYDGRSSTVQEAGEQGNDAAGEEGN